MGSTFIKSHSWCLLWIISMIYCGCNISDSSDHMPHGNEQAGKSSASASIPPNNPLDISFWDGAPQELKEGWRIFTSDGRYRIARSEDFTFPEEAKKVIEQIEARTRHPYLRIGWDINQDGTFDDFAAIVVDNTRSDDTRFGLVIFNAPTRRKGPYEPNWVFSESDLSKTVITIASSRLVVETYLDDGSMEICYVKWNQTQKKYFCDRNS